MQVYLEMAVKMVYAHSTEELMENDRDATTVGNFEEIRRIFRRATGEETSKQSHEPCA